MHIFHQEESIEGGQVCPPLLVDTYAEQKAEESCTQQLERANDFIVYAPTNDPVPWSEKDDAFRITSNYKPSSGTEEIIHINSPNSSKQRVISASTKNNLTIQNTAA